MGFNLDGAGPHATWRRVPRLGQCIIIRAVKTRADRRTWQAITGKNRRGIEHERKRGEAGVLSPASAISVIVAGRDCSYSRRAGRRGGRVATLHCGTTNVTRTTYTPDMPVAAITNMTRVCGG